MFISGSIGVIILKNNKKIITVLADDHSNSVYCKNQDMSIKDYLKDKINKGDQVLLEEVPRDNFKLKELWPDTLHTQELKKLFLEDKRVTGVDIRPYLIPFSFQVVQIDKKLLDFPIKKYMSLLDDFFELKGHFYKEIVSPVIKNLKIKNSGLGKHLKKLLSDYKKIKKELNNYSPSAPIHEFFYGNTLLLNKISLLADNIMEFYTLLNAFKTEKFSIIHTGLFHSSTIIDLLTSIYQFKIIYKNGNNEYTGQRSHTSCIYLPGNEEFGLI